MGGPREEQDTIAEKGVKRTTISADAKADRRTMHEGVELHYRDGCIKNDVGSVKRTSRRKGDEVSQDEEAESSPTTMLIYELGKL